MDQTYLLKPSNNRKAWMYSEVYKRVIRKKKCKLLKKSVDRKYRYYKLVVIKSFWRILKMTRENIIDIIAKKAEMTKKQSGLALTATLDGITEALQAGEKVTFIGFGSFSVSARKARTGINPQTKAKIKIPAKKVPVFRAGAKLKEVVNKK